MCTPPHPERREKFTKTREKRPRFFFSKNSIKKKHGYASVGTHIRKIQCQLSSELYYTLYFGRSALRTGRIYQYTHTERESVLCQDEKKHIIRLVGTFERAVRLRFWPYPPILLYLLYTFYYSFLFEVFFTVAWALGASTHAVL